MSPKKILVVDDEVTFLELIDFVLKKNNYRTALAGRAEEAMQLVQQDPPDLVILDLLMPGMNGIDLCRWLKANPGTRNVPVLFLSATVSEKDIEAGFRAGAEGYIFKPFDPDKMVKKIAEIVDKVPQ